MHMASYWSRHLDLDHMIHGSWLEVIADYRCCEHGRYYPWNKRRKPTPVEPDPKKK